MDTPAVHILPYLLKGEHSLTPSLQHHIVGIERNTATRSDPRGCVEHHRVEVYARVRGSGLETVGGLCHAGHTVHSDYVIMQQLHVERMYVTAWVANGTQRRSLCMD